MPVSGSYGESPAASATSKLRVVTTASIKPSVYQPGKVTSKYWKDSEQSTERIQNRNAPAHFFQKKKMQRMHILQQDIHLSGKIYIHGTKCCYLLVLLQIIWRSRFILYLYSALEWKCGTNGGRRIKASEKSVIKNA